MKLDNFKIFLEGWKNNILPSGDEKELIEMMSEKRMEVCNACPHISTNHKSVRPDVHCTKCGCTLAAKTRAFDAACPLGYWVGIKKHDKDGK